MVAGKVRPFCRSQYRIAYCSVTRSCFESNAQRRGGLQDPKNRAAAQILQGKVDPVRPRVDRHGVRVRVEGNRGRDVLTS